MSKNHGFSLVRRLSVRRKLIGLALTGQVFTMAVSAAALIGFNQLTAADRLLARLQTAQRYQQDADMMHDALRTGVYRTMFAASIGAPADQRAEIAEEARSDAERFRADLDSLRALELDAEAERLVHGLTPQLTPYIEKAEAITRLGATDPVAARAALPEFDREFESAKLAQDSVTSAVLEIARRRVLEQEAAQEGAVRHQILLGVLTLVTLLGLSWLLGTSIVDSLRSLSDSVHAVVEGDRTARATVETEDEIGTLARVFNEMADDLTGYASRLEAEAQRDGFGSQLVEALEMADEEDAVHDIVQRAMVQISAEAPAELLLSDSSRANLQRAAQSPTAGAPGCPVQSPFSCVAVRRGNPVSFPNSEALNACSKLRGRPGGTCSAVCVPVTFMGRALGVLHATGKPGEAASEEQIAHMTTLATQAGARIGTVRAFQKTQLQASTDGLTGLLNRRTLEGRVRELEQMHQPFALAMCDLDRFKLLNDTYGHEAGDRALRLFAEVVKSTVRQGDIVARQGGEEFAIVLPGLSQEAAVDVLERIRSALVRAQSGAAPRFTASFGVTDSRHASGFAALLRIADGALYAAKENGRDRIEIGGGAPVSKGTGEPAATGEGGVNEAPENGESALNTATLTQVIGQGPALHLALAEEEDPRPSGVEIR